VSGEQESEKSEKFRIIVPEALGQEGIRLLNEAPDVTADIRVGISRDDLLGVIGEYDAIITRSGTAMDKALIDAAKELKVIARAGVGVDNVDIQEASRRGIVLINAPTGNTLAAAEHTLALLLSLVRHIPQAYVSLCEGKWDRGKFTGRQLNGKKILVIGLGRIGTQVALRCRVFGMEILGYDPYVSAKRMNELGIQNMTDLAGALSLADVVTIHVPVTHETRCVIDEKMLRAMKPGSYLVNCARGGIVDEEACAQALRDGRLAGAAFDVFTQEPPRADHPLFAEDISAKVVLSPHLGATTIEAQTEVARIAVTNTLAALRGDPYDHAVNLPFMEQHLNDLQKNFVHLSRKIGILAARLMENDGGPALKCKVMIRGSELIDEDAPRSGSHPYTIAVIKGFLEVAHGPDVNYMIAPLLAAERGIALEESFGESRVYRNIVEVAVETQTSTVTLTGTVAEDGRQHIVKTNGYGIDFRPYGQLLLFQNHDRPGVIGKVGKLLGDSSVNIANFSLGRKESSGLALAVMEVDGVLSSELLLAIERDGDMVWAATVKLNGDEGKYGDEGK
jgi:D-3-phosphoglycerate dehydrogenase